MRAACALLIATIALLAAQAPAAADEAAAEPDPFITVRGSELVDLCFENGGCLGPSANLYYNRVDGALFYAGLEYRADRCLHPRMRALLGWPSARDDDYYKLEFEQPLWSPDGFSVGVSLYEKTDWSQDDDEFVSDFGNNLRAFFFRDDYRDYWRADGVTVFAQHHATPELTFRLEYRNDLITSLPARESIWTVFDRDDDWRENPPLRVGILESQREFEGRMKSVYASIVYDSRNRYVHSGWRGRLFVEVAPEALDGDYEFRRYWADVERLIRLTPVHSLTFQAGWGIGSGTDYPSNRLFYLGGEHDLRGYELKEFTGKERLFGRVEYGFRMRPKLQTILFVDGGEVAYATDSPESNDSDGFVWDVGIGFRFDAPGLGDVRIDVARAVTDEERDVQVDFEVYY
jgi:outer membrane protein assembly factor BamA